MEGEVYAGADDSTVSNRTPRFNDIDISNITIKNARVVINIDGLPEMPIDGLHITDLVGYGKTGIESI